MKRYKNVPPAKKVTEKEYFYNKTRSDFAITSHSILPEEITQELGIEPNRSFKKGPYKREGSDTVYTHIHNCWEISSMVAIHEEESISPHIYYLKDKLKHKLDILDRYKKDARYDLILYIRLETETGGMGFDLYEKELKFIHRICNRFGCFLVAKEDVTVTEAMQEKEAITTIVAQTIGQEFENKGMKREKLHIAKNMLSMLHLDVETVAQATGLSQEELMKLQEETNQ